MERSVALQSREDAANVFGVQMLLASWIGVESVTPDRRLLTDGTDRLLSFHK